ncbi:MAG: hydroxymethylglutaryl-CoA synthase [Phycisphaerae bacterium]
MAVGIIGYGAHIPRRRIKVEEIAKVWGADAPGYKKGLELFQKSVPALDEDTITLSVEAARSAVARAKIDPQEIGAVYVGSESHPYAVKPSGVTVAEALGAMPECHCADLEFACKAGSEGMFVAYGLVLAGLIKYGMGIGADTSQGAPGDALEYSAAAGAAAFIMGADEKRMIATIDETFSYMTDTPDFWRREHQFYPAHGGRFTGEPAYFRTVAGAVTGILNKSGLKPADFKYVVFHQPNGKFPRRVGRQLGFKFEQIEVGRLVPWLGNTYSGASPLGLTAVLDVADPGDRVLMCSYGSGAGSDAFILTVCERIREVRDLAPRTRWLLDENVSFVEYGEYARLRRKIRLADT